MSKTTVYEGLKKVIEYRNLPFHHFEDDACTIAFASWEQYAPFDHALDTIPTPEGIKLNIYAERVNGRSDGVAVTVSDEVQHLGYWDMYLNMKEKVAVFEEFLSRLFRRGIVPWSYDYELFIVTTAPHFYDLIAEDLESGTLLGVKFYVSAGQETYRMIHLCFD
jgi:hypothetical protein